MNAYLTDGTTRIYFSAVMKETGSDTAKLTSNPVESGSTIADHYILNPRTFRIQGRISGDSEAYIKVAKIRAMMQSKVLLQYVGKEVFNNCLITSFPREKVKEYGNGLSFTMDLQELFIAQAETVEIVSDIADEETDATLQNSVNSDTELGLVVTAPIALLDSENVEKQVTDYFDSVGGGDTMVNFFSGTRTGGIL
jgi:hypothetical protein